MTDLPEGFVPSRYTSYSHADIMDMVRGTGMVKSARQLRAMLAAVEAAKTPEQRLREAEENAAFETDLRRRMDAAMDRFEQATQANIEEVFGENEEEREEAIRRAWRTMGHLATATDEKEKVWAVAEHTGAMKHLADVLGTDDPDVLMEAMGTEDEEDG